MSFGSFDLIKKNAEVWKNNVEFDKCITVSVVSFEQLLHLSLNSNLKVKICA